MNDIEMRIAIAIACGWSEISKSDATNKWFGRGEKSAHRVIIPDYLNDLNAMHEAEKTLDEEKKAYYGDELLQQIYSSYMYPYDLGCYGVAEVAQATSQQRATAFLKALNLWKEASE